MGQLDRDWYKDHHQKKSNSKRTLDNDPREIDLPQQIPDLPKFTLLHFLILSLLLLVLMIWYFNK